jgi:hypothetical protein
MGALKIGSLVAKGLSPLSDILNGVSKMPITKETIEGYTHNAAKANIIYNEMISKGYINELGYIQNKFI